jgi:leucyl aminopeptidase
MRIVSGKAQEPVLVVTSLAAWKKGAALTGLPRKLAARVARAAERLRDAPDPGARILAPALTAAEEDAWIAILPKEAGTFFVLEFARDTLKQVVHPALKQLSIRLVDEEREEQLADAFGSALAARVFPMPAYGGKKDKQKRFALKQVTIDAPSTAAQAAFERGYAAGEGTNLARALATMPPNYLNPEQYAQEIARLCRAHGLAHRFHSNAQLRKMGAGAFTAVDQGNPESRGGIHEISYAPRGARNQKPLTLVGKGLCFDTGGYDVKVGGGMRTMKGDMQGSSVALATIVTAARLGLPVRLKAYLGVTENHISPRAYKADEVVTALNGLTIEIVNTDAEGRMVLADTLALASRDKPRMIVDFATLTGSAVRAIGTRFICGFTNRDELHAAVRAAGERSGERVWTFPIDPVFFKPLESQVADTLQCARGGGPDHILAACFLSRFVGEGVPWVHLDLSSSENDDGLGHVDSMFTGCGVRWALEFIVRAP